MKKPSIIILSILGICILNSNANSASFDCKKAETWVEKTVCADPKLSKLDDAMAQKYKQNLADTSDKDDKNNLTIDQKLWLKFQRDTCKDTACLIREYREYLGEEVAYGVAWDLSDELNDSDLPSKNAFGEFSKTFEISMYNSDSGQNDTQEATNALSIYSVTKKPYLSVVDGVLFFNNFHTCEIGDSIATWSQNHWVISDNGQDEIIELRLYPTLYKGKTQWLLRDIDNQFREGRCGVRGYFEGIVLN